MQLINRVLISIFLVSASLFLSLEAKDKEVISEDVKTIQDLLYRLDFAGAEAKSTRLIESYPEKPVGYAFFAITKWNILLQAASNLALDDYATPTPFAKSRTYKPILSESQAFQNANNRLLEICQTIREKNSEDIDALYFEGLAYENSSSMELVIRKDTGRGLNLGKRAVSLHRDVLRRDPNFVDANLSVATSEFASATLPWTIRWIAFLIGYRGDKDEALRKLELVAERGVYRPLDARVVIALLQAWKGDPAEAIRHFNILYDRFPENYLLDINKAAIHEKSLDNRKAALDVYQNLLASMDRKAPGLKKAEILFRIGKTYYELKEYSNALSAFSDAISSEVREAETVPLSHYFSALIHEEQGDRET
ncbi:MAG: tetratricopeptide repeat protein, partial [Candidatus Bathyarchaeota archaeon]|nr:tetratricopeptide repeat protein [Candidatus Bathyarchaeota archaeon]